jgi:hypothetical protein
MKGMSGKLPYRMLEDPVFKKEPKEIMKGYSGIYGLYRKGSLYYVGLTKNLFGRIGWPLKDILRDVWQEHKREMKEFEEALQK